MIKNPEKDNSDLRKGLKKLFAKHDKNQSSQNSKFKNSYADNVTSPKQQQKNVKYKSSASNSQESINSTSRNILKENKSKNKLANKSSPTKLSNLNLNSRGRPANTSFDGKKTSTFKNQSQISNAKLKENGLLNKEYWDKLNKTAQKDLSSKSREIFGEACTNKRRGPNPDKKLKKNKDNVKYKKIKKKGLSSKKSKIYISSVESNAADESVLNSDAGLIGDRLQKKRRAGGAVSSNLTRKRKLRKIKHKKENALLLEGNCAKKAPKFRKRKRTNSFGSKRYEIKKPKTTEVALLPANFEDSDLESGSSNWIMDKQCASDNEVHVSSVEDTDCDFNISSFYTSDDDTTILSYSSETSDTYTLSTSDSLTFLDDNSLDDPDYEPPDNIQIIKKGMAITRTLNEDEVQFGETDEIQIVELTDSVSISHIKSISQPKSCDINELKKLNSQNLERKVLAEINISEKSDESSSDDGCPDLVPIVDESPIQSNNDDSSYMDNSVSCRNSLAELNLEIDDIVETEDEEYEIANVSGESCEEEHTSGECSDDNACNKESEEEDSDVEDMEIFEDEDMYDESCHYEDTLGVDTDDESSVSLDVEDECSDDSMSSIDIMSKYVKPITSKSKCGKVNVDIIDATNCSSMNFPYNEDFESDGDVEIKYSLSNDISRREIKNCKVVSIPIISTFDLFDEPINIGSEQEDSTDVVSLYQNKTFYGTATSHVNESVENEEEVEVTNSKNLSARNSRLINDTSRAVARQNGNTNDAVTNDAMGLVDLEKNSDTSESKSSKSSDLIVDDCAAKTNCAVNNDSRELVNLDLNIDTNDISMGITPDSNYLDCTTNAEVSIIEPQTLNSVFYHSFVTNQVLVHLKESISIYGTVILKAVIGSVSIYGHTPENGKEFQIFSPRGCSTVEIIPTSVENVDIELELKKLKDIFISRDLKNVEKEFIQKKDAIVLLKCNEKSKRVVQIFKDCMKENVFPKYKQIYIQGCICQSNTLLECIINRNNEKTFKIQPEWSTLSLKSETKIMIVGGKSVGKSTLVRYLINNNLNAHGRILLIDLDIGQSEMFLPQTVSCFVIDEPLLGPGFFQNKQPAKAYFVGHTSILICSHRYLSAAKILLEYCHNHEEYSKLPWVINTMGYNKGFGLELLALICQYLKPTDIVQIQSNKEINNFNEILNPDTMAGALRKPYIGIEFILNESYIPMYRLHILNAAVAQEGRYQKSWDMTAKDLRYSMILSRLSVVLSESGEGLTANPPLKAKLPDVKILKPFVTDVDQQTLLKSIDTNLVYLCRADSVLPPECYGIGIVTGVDYTLNQIYLLPALPYEDMENVNCVALSDVPIPTALLKHQSKYSEHPVPLLYSAVDTNTFKPVKQIYHRSPEFLTGNRKSLL